MPSFTAVNSVDISDILDFPREKTAKAFVLNSVCFIYVVRIFQKLCVLSTIFISLYTESYLRLLS